MDLRRMKRPHTQGQLLYALVHMCGVQQLCVLVEREIGSVRERGGRSARQWFGKSKRCLWWKSIGCVGGERPKRNRLWRRHSFVFSPSYLHENMEMSPQLFGPSTSKERRQKRQTSQIWTWFAYSHPPPILFSLHSHPPMLQPVVYYDHKLISFNVD